VLNISDEFQAAWNTSSSIVVTCACGHTHFASFGNNGNFDEGELEGLCEKAFRSPADYTEHPDLSYVTYLHVGKGIVIGCACQQDTKYENFIWLYRNEITAYLMARNKVDMETVTHLNEQLKQLDELHALQTKLHLDT